MMVLSIFKQCSHLFFTGNRTKGIVTYIIPHPHKWPPFLPPAIPEDIATQLISVHNKPIAWWTGLFVNYILRPKDVINKAVERVKKILHFKHPIVG